MDSRDLAKNQGNKWFLCDGNGKPKIKFIDSGKNGNFFASPEADFFLKLKKLRKNHLGDFLNPAPGPPGT